MIRSYIKKLQAKDEDTRKLIFVTSLILCMSFISFIWVYSLGYRYKSEIVEEKVREDVKPFKLFGDSISNVYKDVTASVGKIVPETNKSNSNKQIDLVPVEVSY